MNLPHRNVLCVAWYSVGGRRAIMMLLVAKITELGHRSQPLHHNLYLLRLRLRLHLHLHLHWRMLVADRSATHVRCQYKHVRLLRYGFIKIVPPYQDLPTLFIKFLLCFINVPPNSPSRKNILTKFPIYYLLSLSLSSIRNK